MAKRGVRRLVRHVAAGIVVAALPAACMAPPEPPAPPPNAFVGTWKTADNDKITFRLDTVVLDKPDGPGVALGKADCAGVFHFDYATKSRDALTALIPRQPDIRDKLSAMLTQPDYKIAELGCDQGDNTYVLLGDHELVAIYRDGDIAGLDRMSRL